MTQDKWMRHKDGREIRVDQSQAKLFSKQGFKFFDKPAEEGPKVTRQPGRQMNMGTTVEMHKEDDACLADLSQVAALEAAGWAKVGAEPADGDDGQEQRMQGSMYIGDSQGMIAKGKPFDIDVTQRLQDSGALAAGVQFSSGPQGDEPEDQWRWETAGTPGSGSPVEAAVIQFDDRDEEWTYEGVIANEPVWIRVGAFSDQGLQDLMVASNACQIENLLDREKGEAPEGR